MFFDFLFNIFAFIADNKLWFILGALTLALIVLIFLEYKSNMKKLKSRHYKPKTKPKPIKIKNKTPAKSSSPDQKQIKAIDTEPQSKKPDKKLPIDDNFKVAGFAYDSDQDIFYSEMNPWQKDFGYCYLYDEAAAPLSMIIDCEPVRFEYGGKRWMIELWKGQYGMTTGAEIGVYNTTGPAIELPGVFNGTFYKAASEKDRLDMTYYLIKDGDILMSRKGPHWWLTGFKLGEFSEPSELTLYAIITLKNYDMCNAFVTALKRLGYTDREMRVVGNTVNILYAKPHSAQPITRTKLTDAIVQKKNRFFCEEYQRLTAGYTTMTDKFNVVQKKSPELFGRMMNIGKPLKLYDGFDLIKNKVSEQTHI